MHDIRMIRDNPAQFDAAMARRGLSGVSEQVLALDADRRAKIAAAEAALAERNAASKEVGKAKASGDEAEFERLRALVAAKKEEIAKLEAEAKAEDEELRNLLMTLPNIMSDEVPEGPTKTTTRNSAGSARRRPSPSSRSSISRSRASRPAWISRPPRGFPARASWCSRARSRASTGR